MAIKPPVSIGTYVLASFGKDRRTLEASIKYFFTGTVGTAFITFGAGILEAGTISASAYASANIYNYTTFYSGILELSGGMFQIVAHGLIMAMLFASLYFITERTGKQTIMNLGGIFREVPVLSSLFLAGLLASLGLPGLAGFIGEFSIFVYPENSKCQYYETDYSKKKDA